MEDFCKYIGKINVGDVVILNSEKNLDKEKQTLMTVIDINQDNHEKTITVKCLATILDIEKEFDVRCLTKIEI